MRVLQDQFFGIQVCYPEQFLVFFEVHEFLQLASFQFNIVAAFLVFDEAPIRFERGATSLVLAIIIIHAVITEVGHPVAKKTVAHVHAGAIIETAGQLPFLSLSATQK